MAGKGEWEEMMKNRKEEGDGKRVGNEEKAWYSMGRTGGGEERGHRKRGGKKTIPRSFLWHFKPCL